MPKHRGIIQGYDVRKEQGEDKKHKNKKHKGKEHKNVRFLNILQNCFYILYVY